jgi:hypothetical protein
MRGSTKGSFVQDTTWAIPLFLITVAGLLAGGLVHGWDQQNSHFTEMKPNYYDDVMCVPPNLMFEAEDQCDDRQGPILQSVADFWPREMSGEARICLARSYRGDCPLWRVWHGKTCHIGIQDCKKLLRDGKIQFPDDCDCEACMVGKYCKAPFKSVKFKRQFNAGELWHSDSCGPFVTSAGGHKYFVIYVDHESDYTEIYPMKSKKEQSECYERFRRRIETMTDRKIKVFKSDMGSEFKNGKMFDLHDEHGTKVEFSPPYAPQKNGKAERKIKYITSCAMACMYEASMPAELWGETVSAVTHVQNVLPIIPDPQVKGEFVSRKNLLEGNKIPYDLNNLHVLGCLVLAYIPTKHREGPNSITRMVCRPCVMVGYDQNSDALRLWDLNHKCVRLAAAQHCIAHYGEFPFRNTKNWTQKQVKDPRHFWGPSCGPLTEYERTFYNLGSEQETDHDGANGGSVEFSHQDIARMDEQGSYENGNEIEVPDKAVGDQGIHQPVQRKSARISERMMRRSEAAQNRSSGDERILSEKADKKVQQVSSARKSDKKEIKKTNLMSPFMRPSSDCAPRGGDDKVYEFDVDETEDVNMKSHDVDHCKPRPQGDLLNDVQVDKGGSDQVPQDPKESQQVDLDFSKVELSLSPPPIPKSNASKNGYDKMRKVMKQASSSRPVRDRLMSQVALEVMQDAPGDENTFYKLAGSKSSAVAKSASVGPDVEGLKKRQQAGLEGVKLRPKSLEITPSVLEKHRQDATKDNPDPNRLMFRQRLAHDIDYEEAIKKYAPDLNYKPLKKDHSIPAPKSLNKARSSPFWADYWNAMKKCWVGHLKNKTVLPIRRSEIPKGAKLMPTMWAFRDKTAKDGSPLPYARLAARGDLQAENSYDRFRVWAGVVPDPAARAMFGRYNQT